MKHTTLERMTAIAVLVLTLALLAAIMGYPVSAGDKVTVCHYPPGNPDQAHDITISTNALPAHIPCDQPGCVDRSHPKPGDGRQDFIGTCASLPVPPPGPGPEPEPEPGPPDSVPPPGLHPSPDPAPIEPGSNSLCFVAPWVLPESLALVSNLGKQSMRCDAWGRDGEVWELGSVDPWAMGVAGLADVAPEGGPVYVRCSSPDPWLWPRVLVQIGPGCCKEAEAVRCPW